MFWFRNKKKHDFKDLESIVRAAIINVGLTTWDEIHNFLKARHSGKFHKHIAKELAESILAETKSSHES